MIQTTTCAGIPVHELASLPNQVLHFYSNSTSPGLVLNEARRVARMLVEDTNDPCIDLVFGSGYPYYALQPPATNIGEFHRFFGTDIAAKISRIQGFAWTCPSCLGNSTQSLKEHCGPCDQTDFRPLDLLRCLLDLDLVVVSTSPEQTMVAVEQLLAQAGLHTPEHDLLGTYQQTVQFLETQAQSGKLHADIYVTPEAEYITAYTAVAQGKLQEAEITLQAYHGHWTPYRTNVATDLLLPKDRLLQVRKHRLQQFIEECTQAFVRGRTGVEVMAEYLAFMRDRDPKNYRIITSSLATLYGCFTRINDLITY